MQEWEIALAEFLEEWKANSEVIGAYVCGSYVTGAPSKRSDIDVHIILSDDVEWRERGNKICRGYLIEYFAHPPRQIRAYFEDDYLGHGSMSMVQCITGRILFDRDGVIGQLKREAAEWINKKRRAVDETTLETNKYSVWDDLDNLKDCLEQDRADFHFTYHNSLFRLFGFYCSFLNLEKIPYYQVYSYLADEVYLKKYLKEKFPDDAFTKTFLHAVQETDSNKMMELHVKLSQHVLNQMGGFEIDGWKLRNEIDFFI